MPETAIESSSESAAHIAADWLAVGVWQDRSLQGAAADIDTATDGLLSRLRAAGDFSGVAGTLLPVYAPKGIAAQRLLLVGLGIRSETKRQVLHDAAAAAARYVTGRKLGTLAFALPKGTPEEQLAVGVGLSQGCYGAVARMQYPNRHMPSRLLLLTTETAVLARIRAEANAMWLARELVNTPPCELYPETFAAIAADTGCACGMEVEVWDETQLAEARMNSLLAVARGSERPPRFVVLRYNGNPGAPLLGLVGKGVTFDSGGLSLKTTDNMLDMKCDMAGAAAVLSGMKAIAELKLPVNVFGVLALVENMPGGRAMKLGDVLRARNGVTIEVQNTDAEGRLILADALCYAAEQKPAHLLDFATLTGACCVALGMHVAGLMTNNDAWGDRVLSAIGRAGERAWKLPLYGPYDDMISSKVADIRNTGGGRWAGAITAAKFLERFVGGVSWAHLDIAGPAWAEGDSSSQEAGGTGCMVRTIVEVASGYGA